MARRHFNYWISPIATDVACLEQLSSHPILQFCFLLPLGGILFFVLLQRFSSKSQISSSTSNTIWCKKRFSDFNTQETTRLLYAIMSMSSANWRVSNLGWKCTLFKLDLSSIVALPREREITFFISKTSLNWLYLSLKKCKIYRQKERNLRFFYRTNLSWRNEFHCLIARSPSMASTHVGVQTLPWSRRLSSIVWH